MDIENFFNKLKTEIFVEHTTNIWKNSWRDEGDRTNKSLNLIKSIPGHNLFLLDMYENYDNTKDIRINGPNSFKIDIKDRGIGDVLDIRIDIEYKPENTTIIDIYYFVDNYSDWASQKRFIYDLCKDIYESNVKIRDTINLVPNDIYGKLNPDFVKVFYRDEKLKELGI